MIIKTEIEVLSDYEALKRSWAFLKRKHEYCPHKHKIIVAEGYKCLDCGTIIYRL